MLLLLQLLIISTAHFSTHFASLDFERDLRLSRLFKLYFTNQDAFKFKFHFVGLGIRD